MRVAPANLCCGGTWGEGTPSHFFDNKTNNSAVPQKGRPHPIHFCKTIPSCGLAREGTPPIEFPKVRMGTLERWCSGGGWSAHFSKNNNQHLGAGGNVSAAFGSAIVQEAPFANS